MKVAVEASFGRIVSTEFAGKPIELRGEIDAFDLPVLREVVDDATARGHPVNVDLSGATFLAAGCARELRSLACGGRLELRDPSWQAEASLETLNRLYQRGETRGARIG